MKWTPEADQIALRMKADGADMTAIAAALRKTRASAKSRLRYLSLSPEKKKEESRKRHAEPQSAPRKIVRQRVTPAHIRLVPPVEVLQDRERRQLALRDITATLMGDPTFCRSALAKKTAGATA